MFKIVRKGDPEWEALDVESLKERGIEYRGSYRLTKAKIKKIISDNESIIKALVKKVDGQKREA